MADSKFSLSMLFAGLAMAEGDVCVLERVAGKRGREGRKEVLWFQ